MATQYKVTGSFGSSGERDNPRASIYGRTMAHLKLNARLNDTSTSFADSLGISTKIYRACLVSGLVTYYPVTTRAMPDLQLPCLDPGREKRGRKKTPDCNICNLYSTVFVNLPPMCL